MCGGDNPVNHKDTFLCDVCDGRWKCVGECLVELYDNFTSCDPPKVSLSLLPVSSYLVWLYDNFMSSNPTKVSVCLLLPASCYLSCYLSLVTG